MRLEEAHGAAGSVWAEAWSIFTDPAHFMAELGFTLLIDGVVLFLIYQLLFKKILLPRWSTRIHKDIDIEHGVDHHAPSNGSAFSNHVRVIEREPITAAGVSSDAHGGHG